MKTLLFSLSLSLLFGAPLCRASEQAVDSDQLESADYAADKVNEAKIPGEAAPNEDRNNEFTKACDGACPGPDRL